MALRPETPAPARTPVAAPELGMRRVRLVQVCVGGDVTRYRVLGITNRLPIVREVPRRLANALIASGSPWVVRRGDGD
ncbi:MAG: hypothetical protein LC685_04745 [Actinobacteria bacterium]|nr:hypothetical protein [Actinomycetota bacterium]